MTATIAARVILPGWFVWSGQVLSVGSCVGYVAVGAVPCQIQSTMSRIQYRFRDTVGAALKCFFPVVAPFPSCDPEQCIVCARKRREGLVRASTK